MLFRRSALAGLSVTLMCLSGYAVGGDHGHHDHDNHGHEQRSHVHGVAELMLAQEGNELEIMLESPAANIVGFEHKASSEEQIAAVERAEALLNAPLQLFVFNGDCKVHETELDMESVEPEEHGHHAHEDEHDHEHKDHHAEHKHDHDHDDDHKGHASSHGEISAHYHFDCQSGADVTSVTLNLKQHFPAIETLSVSWITEQGQGAATLDEHQLNGSQRTVTFR
ncbi:MAG: hypothetical protein CMI09_16075 [Oceanospirillaceae bacterium]|nr:hypothetical protein [Oceanospirillaceae bacterium]